MEAPMQHGQIFELKATGPDGQPLWAYRYRLDGRGSRRIQRGGYATADNAYDALQRALIAAQRRKGRARMTLAALAEEYLAQHDGEPETTAKLRWLLTKSTAAFGPTPLTELDAREIAAWRMTLPIGHRFEATQALRQTLARAVKWGLIDTNPAKTGVYNPQPPRREMRPFESDGELEAFAAELGPRDGPMVLFAAATGLRPGEWIALEHRDTDLDNRLIHVRRAFRVNRLKTTKTDTPRAVPLQRSALDALDQLPAPSSATSLLFAAPEGGYLDLHNWRPRHWRPAQRAAGIIPTRRLYDLRHTFATVALRAGLGTYELSRYMGTSLINIDRTYGHLARDSHHHAVELLDADSGSCRDVDAGGRSVDVGRTAPWITGTTEAAG
jgi:integrase